LDPIAPATVWTDDDRGVVDLHRLVRMAGEEATFESYDLTHETPQPGGPYRMFSWCTHCLLTWKTIDHGTTAY
jgi:hypothetical protein